MRAIVTARIAEAHAEQSRREKFPFGPAAGATAPPVPIVPPGTDTPFPASSLTAARIAARLDLRQPLQDQAARDLKADRWRTAASTADGLVFFDDIQASLEAHDFVQGTLMDGGATVCYGESGAGKTFWVTDLALHVAAGRRWQGRRVDRGAVIYVPMEGTTSFNNRVSAWRSRHCKPGDKVYFASYPFALDLRNIEADTPKLIEKIKAAAVKMGVPVKLCVIDTLNRALAGGDENGSIDMGALVKCMDTIRRETGANVTFIHHSGKDIARGMRGHSLLKGAIDTEIEVRDDEKTGIKTATVTKQRDMPKGDIFGFRLEVVALGNNQHGEPVTTCVVHQASLEDARGENKDANLNDECQTLLREIRNLFATAGAAETVQVVAGMPFVSAISQSRLKAALVSKGWLQVEDVSIPVSARVPVPRSEQTRLWKRLNTLEKAKILGRTKDHIWLIDAPSFPMFPVFPHCFQTAPETVFPVSSVSTPLKGGNMETTEPTIGKHLKQVKAVPTPWYHPLEYDPTE